MDGGGQEGEADIKLLAIMPTRRRAARSSHTWVKVLVDWRTGTWTTQPTDSITATLQPVLQPTCRSLVMSFLLGRSDFSMITHYDFASISDQPLDCVTKT